MPTHALSYRTAERLDRLSGRLCYGPMTCTPNTFKIIQTRYLEKQQKQTLHMLLGFLFNLIWKLQVIEVHDSCPQSDVGFSIVMLF